MTGITHSIQSLMPGIRRGLVRAVLGDYVRPAAVRKEPRQFHGAKVVRRTADPDGDALILEIRRLREQHGKTYTQIHEHITALGHTKKLNWVRQTCEYHNRAFLTPTPGATSYLPESKP